MRTGNGAQGWAELLFLAIQFIRLGIIINLVSLRDYFENYASTFIEYECFTIHKTQLHRKRLFRETKVTNTERVISVLSGNYNANSKNLIRNAI